MRLFKVAIIISLLAINGQAQDPLKLLPQAYKLQFENDWVKVVRVHYAPREKLPAHEHTQTASAYVYLNDGGPVLFNHVAKIFGPVTRNPTKAGSFRLSHAVQEVHEVENKSDLPSDFLRVGFKTEPLNERSLYGRFYRETYPAGENFQKVQFENEQIRITRLVCGPGKKLDVSTSSSEPTLLIALTPSRLKVNRTKGKSERLKLDLGQSRWIDLNKQEQLENAGGSAVEMLRFDFKTKPLAKEALEQNKKHEHPKN